jgi:hypothetical protein
MTSQTVVLSSRPSFPGHSSAGMSLLICFPNLTEKGCMKRTLLVRKTAISPQKKPLQRSPISRGLTGTLSRQSYQLLRQRAKSRKPKQKKRPGAETAHFRRVALLPCACCGIAGYSQTAHSNRHQDGKGAGIKAHYLATFPLCCSRPGIRGCHVEHDQCIGMTRDEADARTTRYIAATQRQLGVRQ